MRELAAGRLPAPSIHGYTYSFASRGPEDEAEFGDAVAEHLGVTIAKVPPFLPDATWFVERSHADCDLAIYPNAAMAVNLAKAATADGARVLLNGDGGDNFLGGKPHYFAEHIKEGDLRSLFRSAPRRRTGTRVERDNPQYMAIRVRAAPARTAAQGAQPIP